MGTYGSVAWRHSVCVYGVGGKARVLPLNTPGDCPPPSHPRLRATGRDTPHTHAHTRTHTTTTAAIVPPPLCLPGAATEMPPLRVSVIVDSDVLSADPATRSGPPAGATASGLRVGVGMGKVASTASGDVPDPEAYTSFFGAGATRNHRVYSGTKLYACPLYLSGSRRMDEHVMDVWLPSQAPPQQWVLRGVALLCSDSL